MYPFPNMKGKFKEVLVELEPSMFLLCAVFYIADKMDIYLLCLTAAIIHELGHLAMIWKFEGKPKSIRIHPFGVSIDLGENLCLSYKKEVAIYLAGPFLSAVSAISFYMLWQEYFWNDFLFCFFGINFLLCLLNLLPVRGLDGGKALTSFLLLFYDDWQVWYTVQILSYIITGILLIFGIGLLLSTGYNVSLLIISLFLFTGLHREHI
jgi:stage IV sporulation protein FB